MIRGGSALMAWGAGVENLIARNSPDMLGTKMRTEIAKKLRQNAPYSSKCVVFRGEAIRDDGKSPNALFCIETADFRVEAQS